MFIPSKIKSKLKEKIFALYPKPEGFIGKALGRKMNRGHASLYKWGMARIDIKPDSYVLDIGCGGGEWIRRISQIATEGKIYGIDHSRDMVKMAKKVNCKQVKIGQVNISTNAVSSLPFDDDTFDLVTAVESYYFWPDLINDLRGIYRILKPSGSLVILNEVYKDEKFEKRNAWYARYSKIKYHSVDEYYSFLSEAGYNSIDIYTLEEKNWIIAKCRM